MLLFVSTVALRRPSSTSSCSRCGGRAHEPRATSLFDAAPLRRAGARVGRRLPSTACWGSGRSIVLFPLYWVAITSFKLPIDVAYPPKYLPFIDFQPSLHAWRYIFVDLGNDTLRPYFNSVIVASLSTVARRASSAAWRPMPLAASSTSRGSPRSVVLHPAAGRRRAGRRVRPASIGASPRWRRCADLLPGAARRLGPTRFRAAISATAISCSGSSPSASCRRWSRPFRSMSCSSSCGLLDTRFAADRHLYDGQPAHRRLADVRFLRRRPEGSGGKRASSTAPRAIASSSTSSCRWPSPG